MDGTTNPGTPGQGTPAPGAGNDPNATPDTAAPGASVNTPEGFNAAFTKRAKKLEERLDARIAQFGADILAKLTEMSKAQMPAPPPDGGNAPPPDPKGKPDPAPAPGPDPKLAAFEQKIAMLEKKAAAAEAAAEAERAKSRDAHLRNTFRAAMTSSGVPSHMLDVAEAYVVDARKRIAYDDSGALVFRSTDPDDDPVDLASGIRAWLATDDGKRFLPPRGATGSGDRPGGKTPSTTTPGTFRKADIGNAVFRLAEGASTDNG